MFCYVLVYALDYSENYYFALNYNGNYCYPLRVEIRNALNREISNLDFEVKGIWSTFSPDSSRDSRNRNAGAPNDFAIINSLSILADIDFISALCNPLSPPTIATQRARVTLPITVMQLSLFFLCVLHFFIRYNKKRCSKEN